MPMTYRLLSWNFSSCGCFARSKKIALPSLMLVAVFAMVALLSVEQCRGQVVIPGEDPGGGSNSNLTFELAVSPSASVILGNLINLQVINLQNCTNPHTTAWGQKCSGAGPLALEIRGPEFQPDDARTFCMKKAGSILFRAQISDSASKTGQAEKTIEVLPPDNIQPTNSVESESSEGPPVFLVTHKFGVRKGSTLIGTCYSNCVYEEIRTGSDLNVAPTLDDPDLTSCPTVGAEGTEWGSPAFYFASPYITDAKTISMSSNAWNSIAIGDFIPDLEYKQWVGIRVAKCGGDVTLWSTVLHFKVKKTGASKITHVLQ